MRYFILFLFILFLSCQNEFYYHDCSSDVSDYTIFNYDFIDKKLIKTISGDSIFSADIIISKTRKDTIFLDSTLCYCLAICKKESLAESRFYRSKKGYDLVKKDNITDLGDKKDIKTYDDHSAFMDIIAVVKVDKLDRNWKDNLTSDNMTTPFGWRLPPINGKYIEEKLKLK
jgi:hypothetical protein